MFDFALAARLFWEFFKVGLFAVGGGPATLPYLMEIAEKFDWFSVAELTNMIAVSESTPGPLGLNMATYAGYSTLGVPGGIIATLGLVTPSIIVISVIALFFEKFSKNRRVEAAFSAIRPAVAAIIAVAIFGICRVSLFRITGEPGYQTWSPVWKTIIFAVIVFALIRAEALFSRTKKIKKIHPFLWFVLGGIVGIIFKF